PSYKLMENYICTTCGTQFKATKTEPNSCPICKDERQYINPAGQQWTTLSDIQQHYKAVFKQKEAYLYGIGMTPKFGIGQRALLIQTATGNILWDCIGLLDNTLVDLINGLGGLDAIAISHPHYYTAMVDWSRDFGNIPIYLHKNDQEWVMRASEDIHFWDKPSLKLSNEVTLINLGGHFEGGTVLHWSAGADGRGALLTSDILQVVADRKNISFMYSYPNLIPLPAQKVAQMNRQVQKLNFDRIYGAWWDRSTIKSNAKQAVDYSAKRYIESVSS